MPVFYNETAYVNPSADPTKDSFLRMRVSSPQTLFDSKQLVDNQPLLWDDQQVSGSGTTSTYSATKCATTLAVTNATAGRRIRQTRRRFSYQPGKSHRILMTGVMGTASGGVIKRWGYFDDKNGIFWMAAEGKFHVVIRKDSVDTVIPQELWLFDPMDGKGPSGLTLDITKALIYSIDFEWLGAGSVRFGLIINGQFHVVHRQDAANQLTAVYMLNPNCPLRFEIENKGTGSAASMDCICTSVEVEGGFADTGIVLTADRGLTAFSGASSTNLYAIIGFRLKTAYQMANVAPLSISITSNVTGIYRWCALLNPTIAGTAPTWSDVTNSALQVAKTTVVENTVTGGTQIFGAYESNQKNAAGGVGQATFPSFIGLGASIAGVSDEAWICAQQTSATASDYWASLTWREQI